MTDMWMHIPPRLLVEALQVSRDCDALPAKMAMYSQRFLGQEKGLARLVLALMNRYRMGSSDEIIIDDRCYTEHFLLGEQYI